MRFLRRDGPAGYGNVPGSISFHQPGGWNHSGLEGVAQQTRDVADPQPLHEMLTMSLDGFGRDPELAGNALHSVSVRHPSQDLGLPRRQSGISRARRIGTPTCGQSCNEADLHSGNVLLELPQELSALRFIDRGGQEEDSVLHRISRKSRPVQVAFPDFLRPAVVLRWATPGVARVRGLPTTEVIYVANAAGLPHLPLGIEGGAEKGI